MLFSRNLIFVVLAASSLALSAGEVKETAKEMKEAAKDVKETTREAGKDAKEVAREAVKDVKETTGETNMPPRQVLLEKPVEFQTNKINTRVIRLVFPKGYKTPLHTHDGSGPRYVLNGRIRIEENGQSREYGPGEVFWETGQWMSAENIGNGEAELLIVELAPSK